MSSAKNVELADNLSTISAERLPGQARWRFTCRELARGLFPALYRANLSADARKIFAIIFDNKVDDISAIILLKTVYTLSMRISLGIRRTIHWCGKWITVMDPATSMIYRQLNCLTFSIISCNFLDKYCATVLICHNCIKLSVLTVLILFNHWLAHFRVFFYSKLWITLFKGLCGASVPNFPSLLMRLTRVGWSFRE